MDVGKTQMIACRMPNLKSQKVRTGRSRIEIFDGPKWGFASHPQRLTTAEFLRRRVFGKWKKFAKGFLFHPGGTSLRQRKAVG